MRIPAIGSCLFAATVLAASAAAEVHPIGTIRALDAEDAARRLPVTVRGVVTSLSADAGPFTMQDDTGGIWVSVGDARREKLLETGPGMPPMLEPGTEVEIDGLTDQGGFAPVLLPIRIRVVGAQPLPPPSAIDDRRLFSGCDSCLRVQVEGVVQGFRDRGGRWQLLAARGGRRFEINLPKAMLPDPAGTVVDARVRCVGVLMSAFNGRGEFLLPVIEVGGAEGLRIEAPPPAGPFEARPAALQSIGQFRPEPLGDHRVCTEGTVTFFAPGEFFVQDGAYGVRVHAIGTELLAPGTRVQIAGFLERGRDAAGLCEAVYRVVGKEEAPLPKRVTPTDVVRIVAEANLRGRWANAGDFNGCLVEFPARLLDMETTGAGGMLTLTGDGVQSNVIATIGPEGLRGLATIQPGSDLLVRGILQVETAAQRSVDWTPRIDRLLLLMRNAQDVTVLRAPPWWTPGRLATALGAVAAVAAGALAWVALLRRQVAQQTVRLTGEMRRRRDAAVEFQAMLRERSRLAANLHDTLLQTLAGVLLQLDALRQAVVRRDFDDADGQLEVAKRMVKRAAVDLRGSVWALRTAPLAGRSFADSLEVVVSHLGDGQAASIELRTTGAAFEPPRFIAGSLLLAIQEAVRNAIHHAQSTAVAVVVDYGSEAGAITVTVRDDGLGFVPDTQAGPDQGHFGIQGMRERAEALGGSFTLASAPGAGTTVVFNVPIREHDAAMDAAGDAFVTPA